MSLLEVKKGYFREIALLLLVEFVLLTSRRKYRYHMPYTNTASKWKCHQHAILNELIFLFVEIRISTADSDGELSSYAISSYLLWGVRVMDKDRHEKKLSLEAGKKK